MTAIDELAGRLCRFRGCKIGDEAVIGREGASGIRARCVTGQRKGLAAAAAPVNLSTLAGTAKLGHPCRSAKAIEGLRIFPDISERLFTHIVELQSGNRFRRMARQ